MVVIVLQMLVSLNELRANRLRQRVRALHIASIQEASDFELWWEVRGYDEMGFTTSRGVARSAWEAGKRAAS